MPKVIIARNMRDKDEKGWRELAESLEQRMAKDPELEDWFVFIESRREEESQLAATRVDDKEKTLTVGFPLGPPDAEMVEIDKIMAVFASLKKEGRL